MNESFNLEKLNKLQCKRFEIIELNGGQGTLFISIRPSTAEVSHKAKVLDHNQYL